MPLYEYRCQKCGSIFEAMQKFSDEPLKVHQDCGGEVERLLSAPALQFKGSGWYITDYAKSGSSGAKADSPKSSDPKPASGSSSSDSSNSSSGSNSGSSSSGSSSTSSDSK